MTGSGGASSTPRRRGESELSNEGLWNTGSSAFAGDDEYSMARPAAPLSEWFLAAHTKSPGDISGAFVVSEHVNHRRYVRVRIRIMKLSKLSSATCIQASDSLR